MIQGRKDPAVRPLSRPNFGPSFATYAANTAYWALLKQPYKQEVAYAGSFGSNRLAGI
jgi:hypothetical protein